MLDKAVALLVALGVAVTASDPLLVYLKDSVSEQICNRTNQLSVPDGLVRLGAEMMAGLYLQWKKDTGTLSVSAIPLTAPVKSLKEGDTTVEYALGSGSSTPEERLNELISRMIQGREKEIIRYRRVAWG